MSDPSTPPSEQANQLLISLATYNEAGNLQPLVETICQFTPECSILVIDDNSPDGTGAIADRLRDSLPNFHVSIARASSAWERRRWPAWAMPLIIISSTCSISTPISAIRRDSFPTCLRAWPTTTS